MFIATIVAFTCFLGILCLPSNAAETWADQGAQSQRSVERMDFGKTRDGTPVDIYVLSNGKLTAKVMTYGAILTELHVPDRNGRLADVVLGFDNLDAYLAGHPHFGATTGRVANRIAKGRFTLDGKEYKLAVNNGPNSLHGGLKGFDKVVWKGQEVSERGGAAV
jgi:aldose 1-epimerase